MSISGLWHGAEWTFIIWGLYHALLLIIYNLAGINSKHKNIVAFGRVIPNVTEFLQMCFTFILAVIGWIVFRCESLTQVGGFFSAMASNRFYGSSAFIGVKPLLFGFLLLMVEWFQRDKQHALQFPNTKPFSSRITRWGVYYLICLLILGFSGSSQTFIYFQF